MKNKEKDINVSDKAEKEKLIFALISCLLLTSLVVVMVRLSRAENTEVEVIAPVDSANKLTTEVNPTIQQTTPAGYNENNENNENGEPASEVDAFGFVTIGGARINVSETSLDLSDMGLVDEDVARLRFLTNLRELTLWNNNITDVTPLSELSGLVALRLGNNPISDISSLSNLENLNELRLSDCNISDISPLANLTSLTYLTLRNNQISDITPLENLTSLTDLSLGDNPISDWSPVAHLSNVSGRP